MQAFFVISLLVAFANAQTWLETQIWNDTTCTGVLNRFFAVNYGDNNTCALNITIPTCNAASTIQVCVNFTGLSPQTGFVGVTTFGSDATCAAGNESATDYGRSSVSCITDGTNSWTYSCNAADGVLTITSFNVSDCNASTGFPAVTTEAPVCSAAFKLNNCPTPAPTGAPTNAPTTEAPTNAPTNAPTAPPTNPLQNIDQIAITCSTGAGKTAYSAFFTTAAASVTSVTPAVAISVTGCEKQANYRDIKIKFKTVRSAVLTSTEASAICSALTTEAAFQFGLNVADVSCSITSKNGVITLTNLSSFGFLTQIPVAMFVVSLLFSFLF